MSTSTQLVIQAAIPRLAGMAGGSTTTIVAHSRSRARAIWPNIMGWMLRQLARSTRLRSRSALGRNRCVDVPSATFTDQAHEVLHNSRVLPNSGTGLVLRMRSRGIEQQFSECLGAAYATAAAIVGRSSTLPQRGH